MKSKGCFCLLGLLSVIWLFANMGCTRVLNRGLGSIVNLCSVDITVYYRDVIQNKKSGQTTLSPHQELIHADFLQYDLASTVIGGSVALQIDSIKCSLGTMISDSIYALKSEKREYKDGKVPVTKTLVFIRDTDF